MEHNYKATKKEVWNKIIREYTSKHFNKENIEDFIGTFVFSSSSLHIIPTINRAFNEAKKEGKTYDFKDLSSGPKAGYIAGTTSLCLQAIAYLISIPLLEEHSKFGAIPVLVGTNLISGIYEVGRSIKNKYRTTEKKLIEEKKNNLEDIASKYSDLKISREDNFCKRYAIEVWM